MSDLFDLSSSRTIRQIQCIDKWVENKCIGTIEACTGFGKTNIGLIAIRRFLNKNPGRTIIIIVPSDPIKKQWERELKLNNLTGEVHTMNDASRNSYKCALLIIDEIHKTPSPTLSKIFENVTFKIILGLTATFERLDGKDKIVSKYCPVIDKISTIEAINNKWLNDYREYLVLIEPDDIEDYREINRNFTEHFAFFDYNFPLAMGCATDWKKRVGLAKERCGRDNFKEMNRIITIHAMSFNRSLQARKKYINNHPKKIELTNMILEHRTDKKCITFSATIKMAEKIKYGKVYSGKDSAKKGRITLEEFVKQKSGVVNSVKKLNEGFNDPSISVAVILGMDSSKTNKTQRKGRVLRVQEGKTVEIFNLVIKGTVEEQWFRNSVGSDKYITISDSDLINVLEGKEITPKKNKETHMMFRF